MSFEYLKLEPNPQCRHYIESLLARNENVDHLMSPRINFGTAGLRSLMMPGFANINPTTVIQTSIALGKYLTQNFSMPTVVVGFDHRSCSEFNITSRNLAQISAQVLFGMGVKIYMFPYYVATPFIPFCVRRLSLSMGLMFTASHNPKEYSGMKIYNDTGCLFIQEQEIQSLIPNEFEFVPVNLETHDPSSLIMDYMDCIHALVKPNGQRKTVYSAMHGVAAPFVLNCFESLNLPIVVVPQQLSPDPEFPTVKFPNPEEENALTLCFQTAALHNCDLVLANDPDGDRLAAAELVDGNWFIFTGDQIGILLCDYLFKKQKESNLVVLNTVVSSRMLNAYAQKLNIRCIQTHTGFKNIANKTCEIESMNKETVFFAYEEAIGFMCDPKNTCDKDGISAACCFAAMAQEGSVLARLKQLYLEIGYFKQKNGYVVAQNVNFSLTETFAGFRVSNVLSECGLTQFQLSLPSTDTIKLESCTVNLRASGTEPKFKYYIEIQMICQNENQFEQMDKYGDVLLNKIAMECKNFIK